VDPHRRRDRPGVTFVEKREQSAISSVGVAAGRVPAAARAVARRSLDGTSVGAQAPLPLLTSVRLARNVCPPSYFDLKK